DAVRNRNAQHEVLAAFAFSTGAAQRTRAVALRVNPPPFEIEARPLRQHAPTALRPKPPYLVERPPRGFLALQTFGLLRLRLLHRGLCRMSRLWHATSLSGAS